MVIVTPRRIGHFDASPRLVVDSFPISASVGFSRCSVISGFFPNLVLVLVFFFPSLFPDSSDRVPAILTNHRGASCRLRQKRCNVWIKLFRFKDNPILNAFHGFTPSHDYSPCNQCWVKKNVFLTESTLGR